MRWSEFYLKQEEAGDIASGDVIDITKFGSSEFIEETTEEVIDTNTDTSDETTVEDKTETTETFTPSSQWDILKTDEAFKMPEGITKENEQELLKTEVAKKFGISTPVLHPIAQQIQELATANPNLTINDIVNSVNEEIVDISKMSIDEKISFDLKAQNGIYDEEKNPDGLSDDDIKDYIDKLSKVQKIQLSKEIDSRVDAYNQAITKEFNDKRAEQYETNYNKTIAENEKLIGELNNRMSKVENVFGIPVSPEDHKAWIEEFKQAITPDKSTGLRGIDDMLSDDDLLYKLFVIGAKNGESKILNLISKGKEQTKGEIFKKLGLSPTFSSSKSIDIRKSDPETIARAFGMPDNGDIINR